MSIVFIDVKM